MAETLSSLIGSLLPQVAGLLWERDFMHTVANYKLCWIKGRFGSGKTLVSMFMGEWLLRNGFVNAVASNIPITGAIQPHQLPVPFRNACIIMDEAALYLDNWMVAKKYLGFSRKMNHVLLMPSVWPVSPRLRELYCWRWASLEFLGLPLWIYRWKQDSPGESDQGFFGLWRPQAAFGVYNTLAMPADDGGIGEAIIATMRMEGFKEGRIGVDDSFGGSFGNIEEASEIFEKAANRFARSRRR